MALYRSAWNFYFVLQEEQEYFQWDYFGLFDPLYLICERNW